MGVADAKRGRREPPRATTGGATVRGLGCPQPPHVPERTLMPRKSQRKPDQDAPAAPGPSGQPPAAAPGWRSQAGEYLTTAQGLRLPDTDHSLKAGTRGPTLMEDFHFREKITHFDHERIPERVVHARGSGAHGVFRSYGSADTVTRAAFLGAGVETPVFVRFSTVLGSRGSADTVRDTRGFATEFYTR